jgi:hypothetical protein
MDDSGITLRKRLHTSIAEEFWKLKKKFDMEKSEDDSDTESSKSKMCSKIIHKLGETSTKNNIMTELVDIYLINNNTSTLHHKKIFRKKRHSSFRYFYFVNNRFIFRFNLNV